MKVVSHRAQRVIWDMVICPIVKSCLTLLVFFSSYHSAFHILSPFQNYLNKGQLTFMLFWKTITFEHLVLNVKTIKHQHAQILLRKKCFFYIVASRKNKVFMHNLSVGQTNVTRRGKM